jgi:hypothetical protein
MAADRSTQEVWAQIHELLEEGRLDEASEEAERFVGEAPDSAEAHCLL